MATASEITIARSSARFGIILAWIAVLIYASSNSIVTLLTNIGAENLVHGRNAITFCNLLFLGSLISLIPMVFFFWRDWTWENLRALTKTDWMFLTASAFLSSALTPGLFFFALEHTTVTNVVLIGRIDPPLFLLAATFILKEELDPWAFAGGLIALVGAVVIIAFKGDGASISFGKGEIAALLATLSFIASTLVTRIGLKEVPLGIFSIYRTVMGTIVYFTWAMYLFGPHHFQDLFAPVVLKWIWVYAIVVIIIGQFAWNIGLKHARSGDVALATSFSPLAAIVIAMILLGEEPGAGLIPGALVILLGIGVAQYGRWKRDLAESWHRKSRWNLKAALTSKEPDMFKFISSNVFEIIAVTAVIAVCCVLIFAVRHRMKQDELDKAAGGKGLTPPEKGEMREIGLVSAGMAQTYRTGGKSGKAPEKSDQD